MSALCKIASLPTVKSVLLVLAKMRERITDIPQVGGGLVISKAVSETAKRLEAVDILSVVLGAKSSFEIRRIIGLLVMAGRGATGKRLVTVSVLQQSRWDLQ